MIRRILGRSFKKLSENPSLRGIFIDLMSDINNFQISSKTIDKIMLSSPKTHSLQYNAEQNLKLFQFLHIAIISTIFYSIIITKYYFFQTILKDVCYENIDCILKLLDESGAEGSTVLKKTERSFKGMYIIKSKEIF